jgi:oxygen-independent coproporphyrinogen-3 oxidase
MARELALRAPEWTGMGGPSTIYFGGGTPSVLAPDQIAFLISAVRQHFPAAAFEEVTLEANPDDLNLGHLEGWRTAGVDRLSVGVQTFDDAALTWMGRTHSGEDAMRALERAAGVGFERMTLDLMYGLPGRSLEGWERDLEQALGLPINHLSAYLLTVEPRTALGVRVARGLEREAPEAAVEEAYAALCRALSAHGWDHYEVSNFARPGGHAVHNARYWRGVPYLGIGPGAHGFNGIDRYANRPNNPLYIKALAEARSADDLPTEWDRLTPTDRYNEALMTGLRTALGVDLTALEDRFGRRPDVEEARAWSNSVDQGLIVPTDAGWRIPEAQWLIGDAIASEFFAIQD